MSILQLGAGERHRVGGSKHRVVASAEELSAAANNSDVDSLEVKTSVSGMPSLRLAPGQKLRGAPGVVIRFAPGADGVCLTADNTVEDLELVADRARRALFNDTSASGFGRIELRRLRTTGCVRLLAEGSAIGGHVDVNALDVVAADARDFSDHPSRFGVEVVAGAFSLWNRQASAECRVTAELIGISAGRRGAPVRGGGIFVGGTPQGGQTIVSRLHTGEVHSDGGIPPGTPNRISGAVFVVHGAEVEEVRNLGSVSTYGVNDMVLDNWGRVSRWRADAPITSFGPSGIGFVNFGELGELHISATIETHGQGARGFNVYAGSVRDAEFERIVTHGDGAVGIQISQPIGRIVVRQGIETFGALGDSLVKGVVTRLAAVPLSIKPAGAAREISVDGGVISHGDGVTPLELHGEVGVFRVSGGFGPRGSGFEWI